VVIAVDDGTTLEDPEFAGADLLVARADLLYLSTQAPPLARDGSGGRGHLDHLENTRPVQEGAA
jgi:hypothetical protein